MPRAALRAAGTALFAIWLQCPSAAPQSIVEFPAAAAPGPMVAGPDGIPLLQRRTGSPLRARSPPYGPGPQDCGTSVRGLPMEASVVRTLAFGSDGNLWFTMECSETVPKIGSPVPVTIRSFVGRHDGGRRGRYPARLCTPSTSSAEPTGISGSPAASACPASAPTSPSPRSPPGSPFALANGPDGNVWYTGGATGLATVSTSTGSRHGTDPDRRAAALPEHRRSSSPPAPTATSGSPGDVQRVPRIARLLELDRPLHPLGPVHGVQASGAHGLPLLGRITAGPDGNVWFTEPGVYDHPGYKIGRIDPYGNVTEFATPTAGSMPSGITAGPDGNIWFTEPAVGKVGKLVLPPADPCNPGALCLSRRPFPRRSAVAPTFRSVALAGPSRLADFRTAGTSGSSTPPTSSSSRRSSTPACVDGSYWFFASGLTNLEVLLTVLTATRTLVRPTQPAGNRLRSHPGQRRRDLPLTAAARVCPPAPARRCASPCGARSSSGGSPRGTA